MGDVSFAGSYCAEMNTITSVNILIINCFIVGILFRPAKTMSNYLHTAIRSLQHRKAYAFINITGLAIGIACIILIYATVTYHLRTDNFHLHKEQIYRIISKFHMDEQSSVNTGVPGPLPDRFKNDYGIAEQVTHLDMLSKKRIAVTRGQNFLEDIAFTDPAYFEIFNFPLLSGNTHGVVITERIAHKYFGKQDPVGQSFLLDDTMRFQISGVLKDLPANTDLRQEIFFPFDKLKDYQQWMVEDWWMSVNKSVQCFIRLKPGITQAVADQTLKDLAKKAYGNEDSFFAFVTQPLGDIHFNTTLDGVIRKSTLWMISCIGFLLIITTCINFINLSIAQAWSRSKEIGVRKALGSFRWQLFMQFITETALLTIAAMVAGVMLAWLGLPFLNNLLHTTISWWNVRGWSFLIVLFISIVLLSGMYPGLIISGLRPVVALQQKKAARGFSFRRGLVIVQFAISQLLIICTIIIANQMRYTQEADPGFRRSAIVMLPVPDNDAAKVHALSGKLGDISGFTFCRTAPAADYSPSTGIVCNNRNVSVAYKTADANYIPFFGLQLIAGRNVTASDTMREFVVNETAVKKLGFRSPREIIGYPATVNGAKGTVVGVVKDFHYRSFHESIEPLVITTLIYTYQNCAVSINMARAPQMMAAVENAWKEVYPAYIFQSSFLDDDMARLYQKDLIIYELVRIFTLISVVIGCIGLYGLISFMAAQRTKEVGIRKTLGAGLGNILWLFGKEFFLLLIAGFVVAAPVGWWVMHRWLDSFVYRTEPGITVFAVAILFSMIITVLTVGWRAIKTANINPVKSLRTE